MLSRLPYRILRYATPSQSSAPRNSTNEVPLRQSALRNAAFLFAIQHGARFIFDAYPPDDDLDLTSWAKEIFSSMVLGTSVGLVLDGHSYSFPTSVPGAPTPRVLNPYAHFGRSDLWAKGYDVHGSDEQHHQQHLRYRVCEIRQPSMEMFLDVWDGGPADLIAPPVTVPSGVLAPYGSRNVLYTRDAFWGLALFPGGETNSSTTPKLSSNLARALWNHALLGVTLDAGGVRFSLLPGTQGVSSNRSNSILSRVYSEEDLSTTADLKAYIATLTSRVLRWRCRSTTLLPCLSQLASDFLATSLLTPEDAEFMDSWVADLRRVRYLPPPTLPWSPRPPPRPSGPCIHPPHHHHRQVHDPPLPHPTTLTFHPIPLQKPTITMPSPVKVTIARFHRDAALLDWSVGSERTKEEVALVEDTLTEDRLLSDATSKDEGREENQSRKAAESADEDADKKDEDEEEVTENPLGMELASTRTFLGDIADHLCPGFAPLASPLLPHRPSNLKMEDVLLVVWFPRPPRYDLLPALELLRTRHFPNALFCGPPHRALPSMLSRFDVHTSPSFLTASSRSDCLLTALEMGYRVGEDGSLLLVEESALPIPWNLAERNRSLIWFRSEEEEVRSKRSPRETEKKSWDGGDFGGKRSYFRGPEESVIAAAEGLASALRFLARLMGVRPNPHLHPHHHPMEEIDHEDTSWGRMPGNNTNSTSPTNVTIEVDYINETSVVAQEKTDVESTTVFEREISIGEKLNYTDEIPAVVEEIKVTEFEEAIKPVVEHEETPTLEYKEPTLVEYTEPPTVEKQDEDGETSQTEINAENKEKETPLEAEVKREEGDHVEHVTSQVVVKDDHDETTENPHVEERKEEVIPEAEEEIEVKNFKDGEIQEGDSLVRQQQDGEATDKEQVDEIENKRNHEELKENVEDTAKEPLPPSTEEEHVENITDGKLESTVKDSSEVNNNSNSDTMNREDGAGSTDVKHEKSSEEEHTDIPEKVHFDSDGVQHEDTPAIEYSEPPEMELFETIKVDPFKVNETLDVHTIDEVSPNLPDVPEIELNLDANKTVISDTPIVKGEPEVSTDWPPIPNVTLIPWNDNDTKFDLPANSSSSDWVTSADAEEILSSITMIENTHENDTEIREKKEESATEFFINPNVNFTTITEEPTNISVEHSFEIKSPELYDDEKIEEEPVGDGEQSLLEQDTLLSYKGVEEIPQFVGLPSSTVKSHGKSLEASLSESASFEEERRRRKRDSYSYSMDGFKEQFSRARETFDDVVDESSAIRMRLNRSLQEIAELFAELASSFPEDADAVLREEGIPEVVSYPSPHYGLDHTDFRHLHCVFSAMDDDEEEDWGDSDSLHFEPCTILRRFFLRLYYSHQSENSMLHLLRLATTRGSAPIFHLPMRLQRELHLTASLLLSQGFPEEAVLPLLVYGLAGEKGWVNLRKSSFEQTDGVFPMFDDTADFIHPSNLRVIPEEPRIKSVFCLKFLLRVLDG
ncbi:hypothetical protein J437_LFUL002289 [Ladona fulva]|uniref:Uncharacterized protein n=1 Tax=Ladona fulva TaxID=123851 RepID=A0A8K0JXF0_LADFU|nr:hypothetical protein J437_LFUL002289 [Ladona fulva]